MQFVISIASFVLILGVVIFVHELGHFLAARRAGIFVEEFALGMGPILLSFKGKKKSHDGEVTLYSLRAFPIGGFCRMRGQDSDTSDPEALNNKPIPARMLVMAGGALMNFFLAFVLFFFLAMAFGYNDTRVRFVTEGAPAYSSGLMPGDRITHVNGSRVWVHDDYMFLISMYPGETVELRVNRNGVRHNLTMTPEFSERHGRYIFGFEHDRFFGLFETLPESGLFRRVRITEGFKYSLGNMSSHMTAPFRLLSRFLGGSPLPEGGGLMGPIGIGGMVTSINQNITEAVSEGNLTREDANRRRVEIMLLLTAVISVMLGVMNLLPLPALDGARLVFLLIEAVRRKPVNPEKEAIIHFVGLVAFLLLAVFIAYRDIERLIPEADTETDSLQTSVFEWNLY